MRLVKELHRSATGPVANNEDRWCVIYEDGRLFVEHEMNYSGFGGLEEAINTTTSYSVEVFLELPGQGEAHRRLRSFLSRSFEPEVDG